MSDVDRSCPVFKKCGGCQLRNMDYPAQLDFKQGQAVRLLHSFGRVERIIGMENPLHYRNKVQAAFGTTRGGMIISGVYQSGTHRIVSVDDCLIDDETADRIIVTVRRLLKSFKLLPYDEDKGRGFLRHVLVKRSAATGQVMVVLVSGTPMFPSKKNFVGALLREHPEITTIILNINDTKTSLVLGSRSSALHGKSYIEDVLFGKTFRISAESFYQINSVQTQVLYGKALDFAALTGTETVIDAYCGTGTIGIIASDRAGRVIGAEQNPAAVADAKTNAAINGVKNIEFVRADAGDFMRGFAEDGGRADVVFTDPPRAGSDPKFLASLIKLAPAKIVYISCNPETLARDLITLTKGGYKVRKIQPVDMFPFTRHVECVVLMTRVDK